MKYWLMKSEPETFSIDDLSRDRKTAWECVRNYQARNFMMNEMSVGDLALFYHSNAEPPGVAGLMKIASEAKADATAFDKKGDYYDPKATRENPRWFCVDCEFVEKFENFVSLEALKKEKGLADLMVLKRGARLSIQPVSAKHFQQILKMAGSRKG